MLKKHHQFLIKKGLRLLLTNPQSLYYKYKQFINNSKSHLLFFNHQLISQTNYKYFALNFSPEIIIPIYNGYEFLVTLISQLLSHEHIRYKLILINDCSTDDRIFNYLSSLRETQTNHNIVILTNQTNLGFVKSINLGMELTNNHFIILNTDTEVPKYFANKILQPILNDEKIASVTPFTNSGTICSFPKFCKDNDIFLGLDVQNIDDVFGQIDSRVHNTWIPTGVGFCMAINKNVYTQISDFNEALFGMGYGEENDWCIRATKAGYKHLQAINCFVYHKHGGSFTSEQKQQLITDNMKKLLHLHPQYEKMIHRYCANDPLNELRIFLQIKLITKFIPTICIFNSVLTGGTKVALNNNIKKILSDNQAVLLLQSNNFLSKCHVSVYYANDNLEFATSDVFSLLEKLTFTEVVINHLLFNTRLAEICDLICKLKNRLESKLSLIMHDYFFLCPTINLLNANNNYCGLPTDENVCNNCLQSFSNKSISNDYVKFYNTSNINNWRANFYNLLVTANKITVPSLYLQNLFTKIYPDLINKMEITSHDLSYLDDISNKLNYIPFSKEKITIATLGNITLHKGSQIIYDMLKIAKQKKCQIEWVIIGDIEPFHRVRNLKIHGNYKIDDLPKILNKYQVDMFILPSMWPETFCYTASEMMHFNLPIVSFSIGAHAERIANYGMGYLVDEVTPEAMLKKIVKVISKHKQFSCIS